MYMLSEQYRLASGLEEIFNELFYNGKITNAQCTTIQNRPGAQKAIQYISDTYRLRDGIPHVCLNVVDGICLRSASKSRFNLQNIAVTIHTVFQMIAQGLWTEDEISIITLYRQQATHYRNILRSQNLIPVQVFTADSVQGRENKCTIIDIVLAFVRIGGWGFVREGLRLNVAISRSCDQFILVCDLSALKPSDRHQQELDALEPGERQQRERHERELGKHIRGLFNYFEKKSMVSLVKAEALDEISLIDMTPVTEFRKQNACRNCLQQGHRAEQCQNPRVESVVCHGCGQLGHRKTECPDKAKNMTCYNCGGKGHRKQKCPTVVCKRCNEEGHTASVCGKPGQRVCAKCKNQGHIARECPDKRKRRRWILGDENPNTPESLKRVEAENAGNKEPESMPTISAAWENLKIGNSDLDPADVAKALAESDMHFYDDEEESEGKGKGKMVAT